MKSYGFFSDLTDHHLHCSSCGEDIESMYYNVDDEIFCPHCSNLADEKILDIHKQDYTFYL